MNWNQTISHHTQIDAKSIGYDNFPICQNFILEGRIRKTCTLGMLRDWVESNHHLTIETTYDDALMWGYILRRSDESDSKTHKFTYIDTKSQFETEEFAFDAGLGRAIEEIKRINEE